MNIDDIKSQLLALHARELAGLDVLQGALARAQSFGLCQQVASPPFPIPTPTVEPVLLPAQTVDDEIAERRGRKSRKAGRGRGGKVVSATRRPRKPAQPEVASEEVAGIAAISAEEFDIYCLAKALGVCTVTARKQARALIKAGQLRLVREGGARKPALYGHPVSGRLTDAPNGAALVPHVGSGRAGNRGRWGSPVIEAVRAILHAGAPHSPWSADDMLGWITQRDRRLVDTESKRMNLRARLLDMAVSGELTRMGVGRGVRYEAADGLRKPSPSAAPADEEETGKSLEARKRELGIHVPRDPEVEVAPE